MEVSFTIELDKVRIIQRLNDHIQSNYTRPIPIPGLGEAQPPLQPLHEDEDQDDILELECEDDADSGSSSEHETIVIESDDSEQ